MFQISLKTARELSGYTTEDVAKYCGIPTDVYDKIEIDPGQTRSSLILRIATLCGATLSFIFPGTEVDCIKHNRSRIFSQTTPDHILTTQ